MESPVKAVKLQPSEHCTVQCPLCIIRELASREDPYPPLELQALSVHCADPFLGLRIFRPAPSRPWRGQTRQPDLLSASASRTLSGIIRHPGRANQLNLDARHRLFCSSLFSSTRHSVAEAIFFKLRVVLGTASLFPLGVCLDYQCD